MRGPPTALTPSLSDDAQAQFSQGAEAMSQGSEGSPVLFLDPAACNNILANLRGEDGCLPTFSDSEPGTPFPTLEAEETHGERATQTSPVQTHDQSTSVLPAPVSTSDQSTQVVSRPHQATSHTQTPSSAPTVEQSTQVLFRPPRSVAFTQTATAARSTRTSWTQVPRPILHNTGTDMPTIATSSKECQAGCYFDNELISPGAPRPKLPWSCIYAMFDQLLQAYPEVHPEDFVTFGILQEQPRCGSAGEWGEVAGVLANMVGGRHTLVTELTAIVNRIARLNRADPMRARKSWPSWRSCDLNVTAPESPSERGPSTSSWPQEDLWPV